jgi:alkanesulfonate monooxygenase SsuD/methylene tetrahydromethanopterin reductase-like flavin-dependent oxidoreductase (luciferase family)
MGRHAIKTPPHHATWQEFLDVWREADRIDRFESAWSWDHFYPLNAPFDGPNLEGWTMLAALAQATTRLRLGAMVNGMHHRHPAVTANMAATLDHISGGRFELGMGAGWNEMESTAYGIELGTLKQRFDRFDEGIEIIVSLLANRETNFTGNYFTVTNAWCEPKPVQAQYRW